MRGANAGIEADIQALAQVFADGAHAGHADVMRKIGVPDADGAHAAIINLGEASLPRRDHTSHDQGRYEFLELLALGAKELGAVVEVIRLGAPSRHATADSACFVE